MILSLLALSLTFGQLGRWELAPGIVIYLHDFLVILIILLNLKLATTKLTRPILWFSLAGLASLILALTRYPPLSVLVGSLYLWRWLAYAGIYVIATRQSGASKTKLRRWLTLSGFIIALVGLIQYWLIPDTRFLYYLGWDEHYYRLIGTWLDPNFTGIILVLTLILLWPSPLSLFPFTALLLTYSRSSYLAFLVSFTAMLIHRRQLKLLALLLTGFFVALLLLPRPGGEGVKLERLYSLTNRLDSIKTGLKIFASHPFTGIGFNLLRYQQNNLVSHSGAGIDNSFIFILATTGIPGFLAYLWLLKKQFQIELPATRYALLAVIIHSLFNNTLFYAPVMLWVWLLLALDR